MKKILALMFCLVLAFLLVGCGTKVIENKPTNTAVNESDDNNGPNNTI